LYLTGGHYKVVGAAAAVSRGFRFAAARGIEARGAKDKGRTNVRPL